MPYKPRTKHAELQILDSLNIRMTLSSKDRQHFFNLKRGYEGEVKFDALTEKLQCDCLVLNDLLLQTNNTLFQIDSLLITSKKAHMFEVKNHAGDYYYEADKFFKLPQYEILNPLHQLGRSESLLRQLFLKHRINLPIETSVIFINPEFTLYQAPLDKPIILPTQIKNYFSQLNSTPSKLDEKHKQLADKLCSLHIEESPYQQLPSYTYENLRKGMICAACDSFSTRIEGRKIICVDCGQKENLAAAVVRSVEEFKLLFPEKRITTTVIREWCSIVDSDKRIRKILDDNYTRKGDNRWTYFE
ncbi:nuclease-related domain-containing protein [Lentibacillus sp. CBA3610]|uniref:nuclease-related domain-containing protein n=1 Tax=Lentibacillus sp. CBA3610 TaxID=2518176 RepID=UPI0015957EE3|nr:nuclease-related domain-containing protein [Lentibacillus sp. CBA3610]QKY70783.1 NERD domain-containing protein [Lentibacillus sp. CBA3610]